MPVLDLDEFLKRNAPKRGANQPGEGQPSAETPAPVQNPPVAAGASGLQGPVEPSFSKPTASPQSASPVPASTQNKPVPTPSSSPSAGGPAQPVDFSSPLSRSVTQLERDVADLYTRVRPLEIAYGSIKSLSEREKDYFTRFDHALERISLLEVRVASKVDFSAPTQQQPAPQGQITLDQFVSKSQFDKYARMVDLDRQQIRLSIDDFRDSVTRLSSMLERSSKSEGGQAAAPTTFEPLQARMDYIEAKMNEQARMLENVSAKSGAEALERYSRELETTRGEVAENFSQVKNVEKMLSSQSQKLQEVFAEIQRNLAEYKSTSEMLNSTHDAVLRDISSLKVEHEKGISDYRRVADEMSQKVAEGSAAIAAVRGEIDRITISEGVRSRLANEIVAKNSEEIARLSERLSSVESKREEGRDPASQMQAELASLRDSSVTLDGRVQKLDGAVQDAVSRISAAMLVIEQASEKQAQILEQTKIAAVAQASTSNDSDVVSLRASTAAATEQITRIEKLLDLQSHKVDDLSSQVAGGITEYRQGLDAMNASRENMVQEVTTFKSDFERKINESAQLLSDLGAKRTADAGAIANLRRDLDNLMIVEGIKKKLENYAEDTQNLPSITQRMHSVEHQVTSLLEMETEQRVMREDYKSVNSALVELSQKITAANDRVAAFERTGEERLSAAESKLSSLSGHIEESDASNSSMLTNIANGFSGIKSDLDLQKQAVAKASESAAELSQRLSRFENSLQETNAQSARIHEEVGTMHAFKETFQTQLALAIAASESKLSESLKIEDEKLSSLSQKVDFVSATFAKEREAADKLSAQLSQSSELLEKLSSSDQSLQARRAEIDSALQRVSQQAEQVQSLLSLRSELESALQKAQAQAESLSGLEAKVSASVSDVSAGVSELGSRVSAIDSRLSAAPSQSRVDELSSSISQLQSGLSALQSREGSLCPQSRADELASSVSQLQKTVESQSAQVAAVPQSIESRLSQAQAEQKALAESARESAVSQSARLVEEKIGAVQAQLDALSAKLSQAQPQVSTEQFEQLKSSSDSLSARIDSVSAQQSALSQAQASSVGELKSSVDSISSRLSELQAAENAQSARVAAISSSEESQLAQVRGQVEALTQSARAAVASQTAEMVDGKIGKLQAQLDSLRSALSAAVQSVPSADALKSASDSLSARIDSVSAQQSALSQEISQSAAAGAEFSSKIAFLGDAVSRNSSQIESLSQAIAALGSKPSPEQVPASRIAELDAKVSAALEAASRPQPPAPDAARSDAIEAEVNALKSAYESQESALAAMRGEIQSSLSQFASAGAQSPAVSALSEKLEQLDASTRALSAQVESMRQSQSSASPQQPGAPVPAELSAKIDGLSQAVSRFSSADAEVASKLSAFADTLSKNRSAFDAFSAGQAGVNSQVSELSRRVAQLEQQTSASLSDLRRKLDSASAPQAQQPGAALLLEKLASAQGALSEIKPALARVEQMQASLQAEQVQLRAVVHELRSQAGAQAPQEAAVVGTSQPQAPTSASVDLDAKLAELERTISHMESNLSSVPPAPQQAAQQPRPAQAYQQQAPAQQQADSRPTTARPSFEAKKVDTSAAQTSADRLAMDLMDELRSKLLDKEKPADGDGQAS